MNKSRLAKKFTDAVKQGWLCRAGFHDQPLTSVESVALGEIVRRTGCVKVLLRLADLLGQDPQDEEEIVATIGSLELLGLRPDSPRGLWLIADSPIDRHISQMVATDSRLETLDRLFRQTIDIPAETDSVEQNAAAN